MVVEQRDKYSSKHFYAVSFEDAEHTVERISEVLSVHSYVIPAVWFKTKRGLLTVAEGTLHMVARSSEITELETVEEVFRAGFDGSYGGTVVFQWNGERMYAPKKSFNEMQEAQIRLNQYLVDFPEAPAGYKGWFSIK